MSKFVDVSPIIADLKEMSSEATYDALEYERRSCYGTVAEMLEEAPAADVAPVIHARWEEYGLMWRCSRCRVEHMPPFAKTAYCPHCGARMDA